MKSIQAAGGTIRRDLFDDENAGYLQDATLLDALVAENLRRLEPDAKAEGWAWTQVLPDADYGELSYFRKLYPESLPLPDDLQAELDRLQAEYDALSDSSDHENAAWLKLKKGEFAQRVAEVLDGTGWPPESLRTIAVVDAAADINADEPAVLSNAAGWARSIRLHLRAQPDSS